MLEEVKDGEGIWRGKNSIEGTEHTNGRGTKSPTALHGKEPRIEIDDKEIFDR